MSKAFDISDIIARLKKPDVIDSSVVEHNEWSNKHLLRYIYIHTYVHTFLNE